MTLIKITKLNSETAEAFRLKATSRDAEAARIFLLYCAWKEINAKKGYSFRTKYEVFSKMSEGLKLQWQTT